MPIVHHQASKTNLFEIDSPSSPICYSILTPIAQLGHLFRDEKCSNLMKNPIFVQEILYWLVAKMSPIITQKSPWCASLVKMFFLRNFITTLESLMGEAMASTYLEI